MNPEKDGSAFRGAFWGVVIEAGLALLALLAVAYWRLS